MRNRIVFLVGLVVVLFAVMYVPYFERGSILLVLKQLVSSGSQINPNLQADAQAIAADPANLVVAAFLAGSCIFAFRSRIPFDWRLMGLCVPLTFWLLSTPVYHLAALPIAYMTVWLGLLNPPSTWVISKGDYSYGIYLYSFPVQQVVAMQFSPEIGYIGHFTLSLALTTLLAIFSWHVIEKPFQKMKRYFR